MIKWAREMLYELSTIRKLLQDMKTDTYVMNTTNNFDVYQPKTMLLSKTTPIDKL